MLLVFVVDCLGSIISSIIVYVVLLRVSEHITACISPVLLFELAIKHSIVYRPSIIACIGN